MTEPFDWVALAEETSCWASDARIQAAAAYLRERIKAAFVPVEEYRQLERQHDALQDVAGKWDVEAAEATARAEAAEARVRELTAQLAEARQAERVHRGEFICTKCYLRQDADFTPGDF